MSHSREIATAEEFFTHALALEAEATARYRELADQMREHHNAACARLFEHLAALEMEHTAGLRNRAKGIDLSRVASWSYRWTEPESPEATPFDRVHYLMTEHHALSLALENEKRAKDFFDWTAQHSPSPEVRRLAREFAAEEQRHIEMIGMMLRRVSEPEENWAEDFDGPVAG